MKMKTLFPTIIIILTFAVLAFAHATYIGYSGAPGSNGRCASSCHGGTGGTITATGFPSQYTPGQTYIITIGHSSGSAIVQFNGSCRIGSGSVNAGTITAGTNTVVYNVTVETNGIHFSAINQNSGTFNWTAPAAGTGNVTLYISGLQANIDGPNTYLALTSTELSQCCDINMTPDTSPVVVPAGGSFGLTGTIGNPTSSPIQTDVWVGVVYQNTFIQLWYFPNIPLNAGQYLSAHLNQAVPNYAPPGTYIYKAYCGDRPTNQICDSAFFSFTVTGARADGGSDAWYLDGGWNSNDLPSEVTLLECYPNPFNAQTNITFDLPTAGNVNLGIYNLMGQRVATLVDGEMEAGRHHINWDAAKNSSGIYFYKLTIGDKVFTKRMTLLK